MIIEYRRINMISTFSLIFSYLHRVMTKNGYFNMKQIKMEKRYVGSNQGIIAKVNNILTV